MSRFDAAPLIAFTATKETDYGTETDKRIDLSLSKNIGPTFRPADFAMLSVSAHAVCVLSEAAPQAADSDPISSRWHISKNNLV